MKKRLIALLLALTMVGALLAGCGGKDNTDRKSTRLNSSHDN